MLEYAEQAKRALEPLHIARAQHRQATDDLRKRLAAIPPQTEPLPLHPELMILPLDQLQEAHKRDSNALAAMRATATGKAGLRAATASATRISTELAHHEAVLTVIRSIIWTRVHTGRDRFIARVNQYLPAGFRAHLNLGTAKKPDFSFSLEADGHQTTSLTGGRRTAVVYAIATAICAQDPQRRYRLLIPCADTGISGDLLGEMARALRAAPEWIQVILVSTEEPAGRVTDWTVLRLGEERKRRSRKTAPAGTPEEPPRLLDTTPAGHLETGEEFNQETADVQSPGTTLPSVPDALMDEAAILAFIRQDSSLAVLEKPMETPEVPEAKGTSEVDEDGASAQEADAEWDYVSDDDWSPIGDFDEEA